MAPSQEEIAAQLTSILLNPAIDAPFDAIRHLLTGLMYPPAPKSALGQLYVVSALYVLYVSHTHLFPSPFVVYPVAMLCDSLCSLMEQ